MEHFGVDAGDDERRFGRRLRMVQSSYGGLFLPFQPNGATSLQAFMNHNPPWTGEYIGINAVWDLATYVGECVIARRPSAYWGLNTGDPEPTSLEALGFQRPCIEGLGWPPYCDPISQIFMDSQYKSRYIRLGYGRGMSFGNPADHVAVWSRSNPPSLTKGKD